MALLYDSSSQNLEKLELQAVDSKYGLLIPNRLFVGALEADVAETDLRNFFTNFGPVKYCKVLLDANGNSKGYGFVTFVHSEDVDKLLKKGDELMIKNKKINIGPAVRKQTLRPQLMNGGQAALNGHVLGSQGSLVMANRVPCLLQASSGASASGDPSPNTPYNLSYPQMGMMAAGGTSFKQPAMHFMMLPQQEQALINPSAFTPTQISQRQQPQVATQSVLPSGIYPQHLQQPQQQQHKQQPHLYIPSMAPSLMPGALGMDQCLYQFPYVVNPKQQQLQIQQQLLQQHHLQQQLQQQHLQQQLQTQHLQHQLQQQHILNETVPFDFFQQQQQKLQQQHLLQNMKQEQQYLMAQSKTIGSSLQYLEISDVKSSSSDAHFNTQQQPLFFASTNHNSNSNIQVTNSSADSKDTRKAMKRSLTVIQQSEALGTFKDGGVYGVPAAKVLAAESQEGVAKRHKEAEKTEAS